MKTATLLFAALLLSGGARPESARERRAGSCIRLDQVVSRSASSDTAIEFRLTGSRRYRNTLPAPCPHLGEIDRTYTLRFENFDGQRACAGDRFRVVDLRVAGPNAAQPFALCRFGPFERLR